ncbi:MAG TPA: hypothetical protein VNX01_11650 [Bacteroidia bacterium]|nr:hypothetical protein [Bacteroidia bacterium]
MNLRDLSQIATVRDLENLQEKIINEVRDLLHKKQKLEREFFTPKEFSHITGLKYSTVVYHCKVGKLKARLINFQHPKNLPPKVENTLLNFPVSWQKKIM